VYDKFQVVMFNAVKLHLIRTDEMQLLK